MSKKLISIRLSNDLLEKIFAFQNDKNNELFRFRCQQSTFNRFYSLCVSGPRSYKRGGLSIADVVEIALLKFFEDKDL